MLHIAQRHQQHKFQGSWGGGDWLCDWERIDSTVLDWGASAEFRTAALMLPHVRSKWGMRHQNTSSSDVLL